MQLLAGQLTEPNSKSAGDDTFVQFWVFLSVIALSGSIKKTTTTNVSKLIASDDSYFVCSFVSPSLASVLAKTKTLLVVTNIIMSCCCNNICYALCC